jgi:AcrR family transcriptional regulator
MTTFGDAAGVGGPGGVWLMPGSFAYQTCHPDPFLFQNTTMPNDLQSQSKLSDTISHKRPPPASSRSQDLRAVRSGQALRESLLVLLPLKPFEQITIRDICAEAGVHYATFFRHHQTKEGLLDDIAKEQIRQLNALSLAIRDTDDYQAGFMALCQYVADHRSLWAILLNGGAGSAMREEWLRQSQQLAAKEPPVNSWLPVELGTICAATLIAETMSWWVAQPDGTHSVDEIARILYRLLVTSVIAPD